jgi:hypothetical protein
MHPSDRALNRALLARQGLLEPMDATVVDVVEAVGALQAQQWSSIPEALAARMHGFHTEALYRALAAGDLVVGTLIRRTLHLVSTREHPTYAAVADAAGVNTWRRAPAEAPAGASGAAGGAGALRADLLANASQARTGEQLAAFLEARIGADPDLLDEAELAVQRQYNWRPFYTWTGLVRVPADGVWSARVPAAYQAAPPGQPVDGGPTAALDAAVRCHLRAFGPAAADDIATWLGCGTTPVRRALARLEPGLEAVTTIAGRTLYDLPGAPRPDPDVPAPVRLLPAFDSTLLAYAHKHRQRILPDAYRDAVYGRANLRIRPTVLVDGLVAGTWSVETKRRSTRLTAIPFGPLDKATRDAVTAEGERLLRVTRPAAAEHRVTVDEQ